LETEAVDSYDRVDHHTHVFARKSCLRPPCRSDRLSRSEPGPTGTIISQRAGHGRPSAFAVPQLGPADPLRAAADRMWAPAVALHPVGNALRGCAALVPARGAV